MAILVPRRFIAFASGFTKHMATPQDDVWADELLHQIDDGWVHSQLQKLLAARHTFVVTPLNMRTHQFFRTHTGVVGNERVERVLQLFYKLWL